MTDSEPYGLIFAFVASVWQGRERFLLRAWKFGSTSPDPDSYDGSA
jgi:hypothetical protein